MENENIKPIDYNPYFFSGRNEYKTFLDYSIKEDLRFGKHVLMYFVLTIPEITRLQEEYKKPFKERKDFKIFVRDEYYDFMRIVDPIDPSKESQTLGVELRIENKTT